MKTNLKWKGENRKRMSHFPWKSDACSGMTPHVPPWGGNGEGQTNYEPAFNCPLFGLERGRTISHLAEPKTPNCEGMLSSCEILCVAIPNGERLGFSRIGVAAQGFPFYFCSAWGKLVYPDFQMNFCDVCEWLWFVFIRALEMLIGYWNNWQVRRNDRSMHRISCKRIPSYNCLIILIDDHVWTNWTFFGYDQRYRIWRKSYLESFSDKKNPVETWVQIQMRAKFFGKGKFGRFFRSEVYWWQ